MKSTIIIKNYFTKIFSTAVSLIIGFVVTPLLLKYLGKDDFALFKITNDWLSSFGIFEQALSVAILAVFAKSHDDHRDYKTWLAFKTYFKYGIFFAILSLIATPFLPYFYKIPEAKLTVVRIGFVIGSLGFVLLPFSALRFWLEFKEKGFLLNQTRIYQNILMAFTSILFAYSSFGIIGQFSSIFIGNIFFSLIVFYYFNKFKVFNFNESHIQHAPHLKIDIHHLNFNGLIMSLCGRVSFLTDTILLGFYFLPSELLPFIFTQRIILMVQENLQSIGNSSWASLLDFHRRGDQITFEKHLNTITRASNLIAVVLLVPILFLNKFFIELWVGKQYYHGISLTLIASLNAYFRSTFSLWGWCLTGNGNIKPQIKIEVINAIINFSASLILIKYYGFLGPALGTLLGCLIVYTWMFPMAMFSHLEVKISRLIWSLFSPILWAIPLYALHFFLFKNIQINSWQMLFVYFLVMTSVSALFLFFLAVNKDEKSYVLSIVKRKILKH